MSISAVHSGAAAAVQTTPPPSAPPPSPAKVDNDGDRDGPGAAGSKGLVDIKA